MAAFCFASSHMMTWCFVQPGEAGREEKIGAHIILGELWFTAAADQRYVVISPEHLSNADSGIEICSCNQSAPLSE
jgi:hypothetical protein